MAKINNLLGWIVLVVGVLIGIYLAVAGKPIVVCDGYARASRYNGRPYLSSSRTMSDSSESPSQISMTPAGFRPTPRRRWAASRGM